MFIICSGVPRSNLGYWLGGSIAHPILVTALFLVQPKGHQEPGNKIGSQSPVERFSGIPIGILRSGVDALSHCTTLHKYWWNFFLLKRTMKLISPKHSKTFDCLISLHKVISMVKLIVENGRKSLLGHFEYYIYKFAEIQDPLNTGHKLNI